MRRAALLTLLAAPAAAAPAAADPGLLGFMGGQGCTIGADSRAAAIAAGFDAAAIDALVAATLADGRASRQGDYVVLNEATCDIRRPDLASSFTVASPEIAAMASGIADFAADGFPGCFLVDAIPAFDALRGGGEGSGFFDYVNFIGAGIAAGEVSFYGPSLLSVPPGFQIVAGNCADVPQIDAIRRSQSSLQTAFGPMIRRMGKENICGPDAWPSATIEQMDWLIREQGGDPAIAKNPGNGANGWMWMEIFMLTVAAGWHEGMTSTEKGTPRPPLCHYP